MGSAASFKSNNVETEPFESAMDSVCETKCAANFTYGEHFHSYYI